MRTILFFLAATVAATSASAHPHPGAGNVTGLAHDLLHLSDGLAVMLIVSAVIGAYAGFHGIRRASSRLRARVHRRK